MSLILRTISRAKWSTDPNDFPWLITGDLQADALIDLRTQDNTLSVWVVEQDRSNLQRVVTALASNRDAPAKFDYVLADLQTMVNTGFRIDHTPGDTADNFANDHWHRDIVQLSASKLVQLAQLFQLQPMPGRIAEKKIIEFLREGLNSGDMDRDKINAKLLERLRS